MTGPGIYTREIFALADALIALGWFSELGDKQYVLLLLGVPGESYTIHRAEVDAVLSKSFRVWLVKGRTRYLLGDSEALPREVPKGVGPPYW